MNMLPDPLPKLLGLSFNYSALIRVLLFALPYVQNIQIKSYIMNSDIA